MSFKISFNIAYPGNPQSLTKNHGTFAMVCMSRCIGQVLMFVSRLNMQVCGQLTSRQAHLKVLKGNAFLLNSWVSLMFGWQLLKSLKNSPSFSLPYVQIKKTSSIYRKHTKSLNSCVRKVVSILSIKA